MIRHLVHLRFKDSVTDQVKAKHYADLATLADHIDGILDFQTRKNISVETPLVHGFLDMFWFDFRDVAVRNAYLEDPTHQAIGARIVETLDGGEEGVYVCDIDV